MEVIQISPGYVIQVPVGAKVENINGQIKVENPTEFLTRKFKNMEESFKTLEENQKDMGTRLEDMQKKYLAQEEAEQQFEELRTVISTVQDQQFEQSRQIQMNADEVIEELRKSTAPLITQEEVYSIEKGLRETLEEIQTVQIVLQEALEGLDQKIQSLLATPPPAPVAAPDQKVQTEKSAQKIKSILPVKLP
jgi:predicted  nucleic acid-binding Zn-ribbon protein